MSNEMHNKPRRQAEDTLRREYDFSGGVRGKHSARYAAETNVVVLDPDVAAAFPNSVSVNEALRALLKIVPHHRSTGTRSRRRA
jgi:hypothetical protein